MAKEIRTAGSEVSRAVLDFGQHPHGDIKQVTDRLAPTAFADVIEHCACRIGRIGRVDTPTREPPDQIAVHCAKQQLATPRHVTRAIGVVQYPLQLGGREIRVNQQPCPVGKQLRMTLIAQGLAIVRRAAILPDDSVVDWPARLAVSDHGGFTLVGDADRDDVSAAAACAFDNFATSACGGRPQIVRIVFNPA